MKRLAGGIVVVAMLLLVAAPGADAHRLKECGAFDGNRFVSDREFSGAGVFNITTRGVRCGTAHKVVRRWSGPRCPRAVCYIGTFRCRTRQTGYELADTRCTSSRSRHYILRWQSGA